MKKIGFIDYYLNEWHADHYPKMIKEASGGAMEVCYAYGEIDHPRPGMQCNAEWAKNQGIELVSSVEEVIDKSDYIVVLSPDNPECHERLCRLPTASGKRVYIDKTFAPDKAAAERIFERADQYNTPCYSCSALNFASEYRDVDRSKVRTVGLWGYGEYSNYAIHQIEPIVSLMGTGADKIICMGDEKTPSFYIEYKDGRHAQFAHYSKTPFITNVEYNDGTAAHMEIRSKYFENFIKEMIQFFETGNIPVPHKQTIEVIAIREAGLKAMQKPFEWVKI